MINMESREACDGCNYIDECYKVLYPRKNFVLDNCPCTKCLLKCICTEICGEFDLFIKVIFERR